jgi:HAMP domain-containing protein
MVTNMLLRLARLPGADMFLSFIGRRILSSFSLIRGAILVMGVANVLLFQYLDHAEAEERNKLAEQGKLDHLSFVLQTQIQSYESAVWQTGRLPSTISSARDLYTAQATDDLLAVRKLDRSLLAPGGALHDFVMSYLRLTDLWHSIIPPVEQKADTAPLRLLWTGDQALIANTPKLVDDYRQQAQKDLVALQHSKDDAKWVATIVSIIISLISFVLSIALAIVLTRQIVPPVTRLRDALQQVAEGDLSPRAQVRGKDEISELLRTFNDAVAHLHGLLVVVRGHARGISAESRRLRGFYFFSGEPIARQSATLQPSPAAVERPAPAEKAKGRKQKAADDAGAQRADGTEITPAINQLIGQVAEVAGRASMLAASARQAAASAVAAVAAPAGDPAFSQLASNMRALDTEGQQLAEELRALVDTLQNAQSRMADVEESTATLDRAAEELRQAIEQFHLQSET